MGMFRIEQNMTEREQYAGIEFKIIDSTSNTHSYFMGLHIDESSNANMFFEEIEGEVLSFYNVSSYYSMRIELDINGIFTIRLNGDKYIPFQDISDEFALNYYVESISIKNNAASTMSKSLFMNGKSQYFESETPTFFPSVIPTKSPSKLPTSDGQVSDGVTTTTIDSIADSKESVENEESGSNVGLIVGVIIGSFVLVIVMTLFYIKYSDNIKASENIKKKTEVAIVPIDNDILNEHEMEGEGVMSDETGKKIELEGKNENEQGDVNMTIGYDEIANADIAESLPKSPADEEVDAIANELFDDHEDDDILNDVEEVVTGSGTQMNVFLSC